MHRNTMEFLFLSGAIAALATGASAQPTGGQESAKATMVGEVIVTAQRREERVRDVPLSITAATAEMLTNAGIQTTADLQKITPGYMIYMYGGAPQPVIRGISSGGASAGDSSNVAVYVDGVYMGNEQTQLFDLPDISRVEILKGPQGTLFGRNAAGGAVRVITQAPSFTPTGSLAASYGSFNDRMFKGTVSGPIAPKLAASAAAFYEKNDGWDHNVLTGKRGGGLRSIVLRGKLLFQPMDDLKITLSGYYLNRRNEASFSGVALGGNTAARTASPGVLIVTKPRDFAVNTPVGSGVHGYGTALNIEYNAPFGTLTSVTAYQKAYVFIKADADATPAGVAYYDQHQPINSIQEEVDFASRTMLDRFSFTLGAFYYGSHEHFEPLAIRALPDGPGFSIYENAKTSALAVFGEGYLDVTDRLQVIGGLRYSHERKYGTGAFGSPAQSPIPSATFSSVTPRVSVKYSLNEYSNVYFTYSQGFKSGVNDPVSGPAPILPEHVRAYEVGVKSRLTPALEVTAALFRYDYTNLQVQTVGVGLSGSTQNAARARINGFEGNATWSATHDLTVIAGVSILDGKYGSFPAALVNVPTLLPNGQPCLCGAPLTPVNVKGKKLQRTAPWTGNVTAEYSHAFNPGTVSADVTVFSTARWWADLNNRVGQPAYTTVDAQIGWQPANTHLKISLWGKNLTNKTYIYSFFVSATADEASYAAPVSGGVRLDYNF
jgi:iron complex outermembrane receptor protein